MPQSDCPNPIVRTKATGAPHQHGAPAMQRNRARSGEADQRETPGKCGGTGPRQAIAAM
jgi:hypothetical protein